MSVTLHLLGRPRIRLDGQGFEPAPSKPLCLLLYLGYAAEWVGRERLAFLFWPDSDDSSAKRNLRQLIRRARALPFALGLEIEDGRLRWRVDSDVAEFRRALAAGDWQGAADLQGDSLLSGLDGVDSEAFRDWLELEREALRSAWQGAVQKQAAALEAQGGYLAAADLLGRLLVVNDLAEDVLQHYLRVSYLAGQRERALSAYESFERRLREELDLTPLEPTVKLAASIRSAAPLEGAPPAPPGAGGVQVPLTVMRPPRLIGREAELSRLAASRTPVALLAGEAGVGKSRLMAEAAPDAFGLRCHEGMERVPFYPLTVAIRERLGRGAPTPALGPYLADLARLVPEVAPELKPEPADPEASHGRLLEALARYLEGVGPQSGAFGVSVDDLQWADEASLAFITFLAHRRGLRLLGAYRVHEQTPALQRLRRALRSARALSEVRLEPLDEDAVETLMATLMETRQGPPIFSRWLHRGTGGNPMFVLETLKALFEAGTLEAGAEGWQTGIDDVTRDYREITIPEAVSELIGRRVDGLDDTTRRVLRTASVLGRDLTPRLLGQVAGLSELAVVDALADAERVGLVRADGFAHDLIRQTVYGSLATTQRRLLHARVAEALPGDTEPTVRAEHWLAAGRLDEAVEQWLSAARDFRWKGLFEPAIGLLERSAELAEEPEARDRVEAVLASVLQQAGRNADARRLAESLLERSADPRLRAEALNTLAVVALREGRVDAAQASVTACLELIEAVQDADFRGNFTLTRAILHHARGDAPAATALLETELARLRTRPFSAGLGSVLTSLAAAYDVAGDHDKALPLHREALRLAKVHGFRYFHIDAALNLLYCLMDLGRTEEGLADAEAALELGHFENTPTLRTNLATAYFELGRYRDALRHYDRVVTETEHDYLLAICWARLAETHVRLSHPGKVAGALDEAFRWASRTDVAVARARVLISTLRHGTSAQRKRVGPWLVELDGETLPDYVRAELAGMPSAEGRDS